MTIRDDNDNIGVDETFLDNNDIDALLNEKRGELTAVVLGQAERLPIGAISPCELMEIVVRPT